MTVHGDGSAMREEELETAIKVVVVGNGAVGKSSMIQRYCKGIFTKDYKKTIGVDFLERQIEVNGEDVRLMLWDTAGQEEFDAITKAYYRGAQACVLAFSTVDRDSFLAVEHWKKKVEDEVGNIAMVLIQNKIDLSDEALVSNDEAENLARSMNLKFYKTSVKENTNVEDVFRYLAERYLAQVGEENSISPQQKIGPTLFTTMPNSNSTRSDKRESATIQLHPTKRRTQGKKSPFQRCTIL